MKQPEFEIDPVFDSLLEELLTQQHPPDLSARIVTVWRRERAQQLQADVTAGTAAVYASREVPSNRAVQLAPGTAARQTVERARGFEGSRQARLAWGLVACAATALLFVSWQTGVITFRGLVAEAPLRAIVPPPKGPALEIAEKPSVAPLSPETLEINDLPFPKDDVVLAANPVGPRPAEPIGLKLSNDEVVGEVNRRLAGIWQSLNVSPTEMSSPEQVSVRVSKALTGQDRSAVYNSAIGLDKEELVKADTESIAFARLWAATFTEQWVGQSNLKSEDASALTQRIVERIYGGAAWNEVVLDVLGGDLKDPSSPSSRFISALAGGENHRLVERLGSSFLDANLNCVRCHDAGPSPKRDTDQQATYWFIVALLKGIDAQDDAGLGKRVVLDRQAELFAATDSPVNPNPSTFFDLPNGFLKAAEARLPDGSAWEASASVPRLALAQWISTSPEFDRATVNHVWKSVFGRHLTPRVSLVDTVAVEERAELMDFLAGQFRAHDRSLQELVGWVVSLDAFAKQPMALSKSEWLQASDSELEELKLRELAFAAGPVLDASPESTSLEASLLAVVNWTRATERSANDNLLAQRTPSEQPVLDANRANSIKMPALGYILHGEQHTIAEQNFVARLLNAKRLSWEERVEHVVGLGGRYSANSRVQQLAKELLEQNAGDPKTALLQLLWAVENAS